MDASALQFDELIGREWLTVNRIGGYAASTLPSLNTRKYHGLLVASMAPPVRQMVLLSRVQEVVRCNGRSCELSCAEYPGAIHPQGHQYLRAFDHEPFPRWAYQGDGWTIQKELRLLRGENTVCLSYTLLGGTQPIELDLQPMFALRGIHELAYQWNGRLAAENLSRQHHRIPATLRTPEVFFAHDGAWESQGYWYQNNIYRREHERGYAGLEDVWMPGVVRWKLNPGQSVHFVCSTDPIEIDRVISELDRQVMENTGELPHGVVQQKPDTALQLLVRAADQYVVHTRDRTTMVMSGYLWTAPSGRDALISLPGLLLITGRFAEARSLLEYFARLMVRGLMPSEFPTDGSAPRYEAADASLWFINAAHHYLRYTGDDQFVARRLLPVIREIISHYQRGTDLGIRIDTEGLLVSHQIGVPTTWMNARTGDHVVTPRAGRAVEVNALWYNALSTAADLCDRFNQANVAVSLRESARHMQAAFNRRFWNPMENCCYDVVDDSGPLTSVRPNQLLAISLPYAVLNISHQVAVLDRVRSELLTPFGLRTLSRNDPSYHGHYAGNAAARDRAYHRGSVYPWLLGPYITATVRVHGRSHSARDEAGRLLTGCLDYMRNAGTGQLCELFDGDAPHHPGGAIASARSVAELLRAYVEDVLDLAPSGSVQAAQSAGAKPAVYPIHTGRHD